MNRGPDASVVDESGAADPSWLDEVSSAMKLPPTQARAALDGMIAQRRRRAAELRARQAGIDDDPHQRQVLALMARWVDDSITLLERARDHVAAPATLSQPGQREHRRAV